MTDAEVLALKKGDRVLYRGRYFYYQSYKRRFVKLLRREALTIIVSTEPDSTPTNTYELIALFVSLKGMTNEEVLKLKRGDRLIDSDGTIWKFKSCQWNGYGEWRYLSIRVMGHGSENQLCFPEFMQFYDHGKQTKSTRKIKT